MKRGNRVHRGTILNQLIHLFTLFIEDNLTEKNILPLFNKQKYI